MNNNPGLTFDKQAWLLSVMDKMVDLLALLNTMGGKESGRDQLDKIGLPGKSILGDYFQ